MSLTSDSKSPYKPLTAPTSVRLLKLEGPCNSKPISCSIEEFDFKDCPSFRALSYTWGPPYRNPGQADDTESPLEFLATIICNGCRLSVTNNLLDALTQLNQMPEVNFLWIDALCINQNDLNERAAQVLIMGDIYSSAEEVICWLGEPNDYFQDFFWVVNVLYPKIAQFAEESSWEAVYASSIVDPAFVQQLGITDLRQRYLGYGLYHNSNRWFVRSWVVQEVVNAIRIRVFCGSIEILWENIAMMSAINTCTGWLHQFRHSGNGGRADTENQSAGMDVFLWEELRNTSRIAKSSSLPNAESQMLEEAYGSRSKYGNGFAWFFHIMKTLRLTYCHDPRDKVYAALSIAESLFPDTVRNFIAPDYTASINEIFTSVTGMIIQHSESINFLSFVDTESSNCRVGLPSWVPDYDRRGTGSRLPFFRGFDRFDTSLSRSSTEIHCAVKGHLLILHGANFDDIVQTHPLSAAEWVPNHMIHTVLSFCSSLPESVNGQSRTEMLWRTFMGDTSMEGQHPAPKTVGENFRAFVQSLAAVYIFKAWLKDEDEFIARAAVAASLRSMQCPTELPSIENIDQYLALLKSSINLVPGTQEHTDYMAKMVELDEQALPFMLPDGMLAFTRRLFRTAHGFLGIGPDLGKQNDQIWLIDNSHVPLVLRPTGSGTFELVGECYLHGFMHGEMLEDKWNLKDRIAPITMV